MISKPARMYPITRWIVGQAVPKNHTITGLMMLIRMRNHTICSASRMASKALATQSMTPFRVGQAVSRNHVTTAPIAARIPFHAGVITLFHSHSATGASTFDQYHFSRSMYVSTTAIATVIATLMPVHTGWITDCHSHCAPFPMAVQADCSEGTSVDQIQLATASAVSRIVNRTFTMNESSASAPPPAKSPWKRMPVICWNVGIRVPVNQETTPATTFLMPVQILSQSCLPISVLVKKAQSAAPSSATPVMIHPMGPVAKRRAAPSIRVAPAATLEAIAPALVATVRARSAMVARTVERVFAASARVSAWVARAAARRARAACWLVMLRAICRGRETMSAAARALVAPAAVAVAPR